MEGAFIPGGETPALYGRRDARRHTTNNLASAGGKVRMSRIGIAWV
jgi:hypothetical protein